MKGVRFTNHAVTRSFERLRVSLGSVVPYGSLIRAGKVLPDGAKFEMHSGGITFCCVNTRTGVVILTVYEKTKHREHPKRHGRKNQKRKRRKPDVWD